MGNEMINGNPESDSNAVNEQAMYSSIMYMPLNDLKLPKDSVPTLEDILDAAESYVAENRNSKDPKIQKKVAEAESYGSVVSDMAENLGIKTSDVTMNNPSWASEHKGASFNDPNGLLACTFTNGKGETTISFRGTPAGAWLDNGYSLASPNGPGGQEARYYYTDKETGNRYGPMSDMDYATLEYTEYALGQTPRNAGPTAIYTTGHSKGGHEAMLAAMVFSQINQCYSFDGYGISPEFYSKMAYYFGDEFDQRRSRIIAVNGNNDFVNGLGIPLALDRNTMYLFIGREDELGWPNYLHDIRGMLENGVLRGIDENGRGGVSVLFSIVDAIMNMNPNARNTVILGGMYIVQWVLTGQGPIGGAHVPAIISAVLVVMAVVVAPVVVVAIIVALVKFGAIVLLILAAIVGVVCLFNWLKSLFDGGKHTPVYALGTSTLIRVETDTLDAYIAQLTPLGNAIDGYTWRAKSISERGAWVGLNVPAGYAEFVGVAEMVRATIKYLNKTKSKLESAEKNVLKKAPSV